MEIWEHCLHSKRVLVFAGILGLGWQMGEGGQGKQAREAIFVPEKDYGASLVWSFLLSLRMVA